MTAAAIVRAQSPISSPPADSQIRVVHHPVNRGYGGAVISGMRACTLPFILLSDSDGQFDPAEMSRLIAHIGDHDVVIGRRAYTARTI